MTFNAQFSMKKTFTYIAGGFIILLSIILVTFSLLPNDFDISRTTTIQAPSLDIHVYVGDLARWPEWNPWENSESDMRIISNNKTQGVGAHQVWEGKDGKGELILTESSAETGIKFDLIFEQNSEKAQCYISYAKADVGTQVTWGMKGKMNVPVFGPLIAKSMDGIIGPIFEIGLTQLKTTIEKRKQNTNPSP